MKDVAFFENFNLILSSITLRLLKTKERKGLRNVDVIFTQFLDTHKNIYHPVHKKFLHFLILYPSFPGKQTQA